MQKDFRKRQNYETGIIFTILFWAAVLRVESFNKLEKMLEYGCFNPLFPRSTKLPSIDAISEALTKWDIERLKESFKEIIIILHLNKAFDKQRLDGYRVVAIDGSNVIASRKKKCKDCATMKNGTSYYYGHKTVVAMNIGEEASYVLDEFSLKVKEEEIKINEKTLEENVVTKSEGEHTGAMTLLKNMPKWVDVVVADSLYFTSPFFKAVLKGGKQAVVRLEDETRQIYKEIKEHSLKNRSDGEFKYKDKDNDNKIVYVNYWVKDTKIEDSNLKKKDPLRYTEIRIYKFIEVVEIEVKGEIQHTFREIYVGTTDKEMDVKTVLKITHKRWIIENSCFHVLKGYCSMEHCFRHDSIAIEAILNIMFMAYNLIQSYLFNRLKNFKEEFKKGKETISWFVKELEYELVKLDLLIRIKLLKKDYLYST